MIVYLSVEQKWSKTKAKEKVNNAVLFDQDLYKKVLAEAPKQRLITPANLSEKFKLNGSLARKAIKHLYEKGLIRRIAHHHSTQIYTRALGKDEEGAQQ